MPNNQWRPNGLSDETLFLTPRPFDFATSVWTLVDSAETIPCPNERQNGERCVLPKPPAGQMVYPLPVSFRLTGKEELVGTALLQIEEDYFLAPLEEGRSGHRMVCETYLCFGFVPPAVACALANLQPAEIRAMIRRDQEEDCHQRHYKHRGRWNDE